MNQSPVKDWSYVTDNITELCLAEPGSKLSDKLGHRKRWPNSCKQKLMDKEYYDVIQDTIWLYPIQNHSVEVL